MGIFGSLPSAVSEKAEKTVIAKGTRITGQVNTDALLLIDGNVDGDVHSTTEVSIGANGHFKGNIQACHLIVNGHLEGTVRCDKMEILKNGLVKGEVNLKEFTIEPGGRFFGESREADTLLGELQPNPKLLPKG